MIEKVYYGYRRNPVSGLRDLIPSEIKREPYVKGSSVKDDILASSLLHRPKSIVVA